MKKTVFLMALVLGALAVALGACGGGGGGNGPQCQFPTPKNCNGTCAECCSDGDCPGGTCSAGVCQCPATAPQKCDADHMCVQCCQDSQCDDSGCPGNVKCQNFRCKPQGIPLGKNCFNDPTHCCPGFSCDVFTNTCQPECTSDNDCHALDIPFADDTKCTNGVCDFTHCVKDENCVGGKVCFNGDCVSKPDCSEIASCQVVPASAVTQQGTQVQYSASAFFRSGALAPGITFNWSSSDADVADVGAATGVVTGDANTGTATITATVTGCTPAITCTASVRNYGAVGTGSRVVVLSELEQTPIEGATVISGTETVQTDENGVALLAADLSAAAADVHIFHPQYHYLSLRGVNQKDVLANLGKLYQFDFGANPPKLVAGGIKGKFDFSRVGCPPGKQCDVTFGLGGLSIPGNLVNLNFDLLIGGMIKTTIDLSGSPQVVPLPAGLTLAMNETEFKEFYTPTGIPGVRTAWGIGGRLVLTDLLQILAPVISGGNDIDIGPILVALLPMFANFYTSIQPAVVVTPRDMVVDVNDINDNKKTDDLVPDYDNFPRKDMQLTVKTDQTMTFTIGALPGKTGGGFWYDGVIVLGGVIAKGVGLIPLGISAGVDAPTKNDTPDGHIDNITLNCSDVAGRIPEDQIKRVIVVLALNMGSLGGSSDEGLALAGVVKFVDQFSGTHNISGFLTPPASAAYSPTERKLTVSGIPSGITFNQVIFAGNDDANWNVMGVFTDGDYVLPTAPAAGDRSKEAKFISMKLAGGLTYQQMLHFDEDNMGRLVELVESFCFYEIK